jgi:hypothetical protein
VAGNDRPRQVLCVGPMPRRIGKCKDKDAAAASSARATASGTDTRGPHGTAGAEEAWNL